MDTLNEMASLHLVWSPTYLCRILVDLLSDLVNMHATGISLANNFGNVKSFNHSECSSKMKLQSDSVIESI